MADQCIVTDSNAALILKTTTRINEYSFTDVGVLTTVSGKRREQAKRIGHLSPGETRHQLDAFFHGCVLGVEFHTQLNRFFRQLDHFGSEVSARKCWVARTHLGNEIFSVHSYS